MVQSPRLRRRSSTDDGYPLPRPVFLVVIRIRCDRMRVPKCEMQCRKSNYGIHQRFQQYVTKCDTTDASAHMHSHPCNATHGTCTCHSRCAVALSPMRTMPHRCSGRLPSSTQRTIRWKPFASDGAHAEVLRSGLQRHISAPRVRDGCTRQQPVSVAYCVRVCAYVDVVLVN